MTKKANQKDNEKKTNGKVPKKAKKRKVKHVVCKSKNGCGYSFDPTTVKPNKTWNMVAPMPDKDGNVTISIMATWKCPRCTKTIRGTAGKTKGEIPAKSKKQILIEKLEGNEKIHLADIAKELGYKVENVMKMINLYIKTGKYNVKIVDGTSSS